MHWKFDIDQRSLLRASDDLSVKSAKIAFPDKYPIKVDFYRGTTLVDGKQVPAAFLFTGKLKAVVKPTNQQQSLPLAAAEVPVTDAETVEMVLSLATTQMAQFVKDFGERPCVLELLALDSSGAEVASWTVSCDVSRRYVGTDDVAVDLPDFRATQAEAEAGANNTKWMTPLRVWDAIRKWALDYFKWDNLQDKPLTFPPSPHIHTDPLDLKQALKEAGVELLD
jgi:hypothetical protein